MFVFDYGRTLYDRESATFFPDAEDVLCELAINFRLAIVSYSQPGDVANRAEALRLAGLTNLFEEIVFVDSPERKDEAYSELSLSAGVPAENMAIVDDYIIRGIAWGNRNGATTYWFQNGKFSAYGPTNTTGLPTYTIHSLSEILESPAAMSHV